MAAIEGVPCWDDEQYLKFAAERTRPAVELLSRVRLDDERTPNVVDLGCGPGNSTALLRARWPRGHVVGVDDSSEMIARARRDYPEGRFVLADARELESEAPLHLVFANALFQWLPDHQRRLGSLMEWLCPGGTLAVQMPHNLDEPSHRLMRNPGPGWAERLASVPRRPALPSAVEYYDLLAPRARRVDVWQTTYQHVMNGVADIVEWVRGTGLRPYLAALDPSEHDAYLDAYARGLDEAYPRRSDGKRLLSFPRLFFVAVR